MSWVEVGDGGGTSGPPILNGTYTPTITPFVNVAAASPIGLWKFTRLGNVVSVFGEFQATVVAIPLANPLIIRATLPIPSNLSLIEDVAGSAVGFTVLGGVFTTITWIASQNGGLVEFDAMSNGLGGQLIDNNSVLFEYLIVP